MWGKRCLCLGGMWKHHGTSKCDGQCQLVLTDACIATAASLSQREVSRGVCRRCCKKKRPEICQCYTYGAPSEDGMLMRSHTSYVAHLHPNKYKLWAHDGQLKVSYQSWYKYPHPKPLPQADNVLKPTPRIPAYPSPLNPKAFNSSLNMSVTGDTNMLWSLFPHSLEH